MIENVDPMPGTGKPSDTSNFVARCGAAAPKNANAALLLMRICYWMPKATIRRGGHTWIAKSAAEWCVETSLTFDQYKRAVAWLRRQNLVVSEQHLFGGKNITFIRLTERGTPLLPPGPPRAAPPELGTSAQPELGTSAQPELGNLAQLHLQGDSHNKNQQGEGCVLTHAGSPGEDSPQEDFGEQAKTSNSSPTEAGPEICASARSMPDLETVWRTTLAEVESIFVPPLTAKNKGQLNCFAKRCPDRAAADIMAFCIRRWPVFTQMAKSHAGLFKAPAIPEIGFLLRHVGIAVNLYAGETTKAKSGSTPVQSRTLRCSLPDLDDQKPESLQDLLDVLHDREI